MPEPATMKVAIVAALEREIWPLVKSWSSRRVESGDREFQLFEQGGSVAVCGGIGAEAARRTCEAVIAICKPDWIISAGYAGALSLNLKVGEVLRPVKIIDASDGSSAASDGISGVLVSTNSVASVAQKRKLADAYGANAVDMEAAAVAKSAMLHGIRFLAVKAISDDASFEVPNVDDAVDERGRFHTGKFAAHVIFRPWVWRRVAQMGANSATASEVLSQTLKEMLKSDCG